MFYKYYELSNNLKIPKKIQVNQKMDDYVFFYSL